jgi:hypothetical protein
MEQIWSNLGIANRTFTNGENLALLIWSCFLFLFSPFYQLLGGTPFHFLVFHGRYDTPSQLSVLTLNPLVAYAADSHYSR